MSESSSFAEEVLRRINRILSRLEKGSEEGELPVNKKLDSSDSNDHVSSDRQ